MDPDRNRKMQHEESEERRREREEARGRIEKGERPWEEMPGVMSVVDAVRDVEFPKSVDDLRDAAGEREVLTSNDVRMPLARVLGKLKGEDRFDSLRDFQSAVQRHWAGVEVEETPPEERPGEAGGPRPGSRD